MLDKIVITIKPLSPFSSSIKGDSLFGQICHTINEWKGVDYLEQLLQGYTENKPFLIVSDAFPKGYLPLPCVPINFYQGLNPDQIKQQKKISWMPAKYLNTPFENWLKDNQGVTFYQELITTRNHINPLTNTTGEGYAPFNQSLIRYDQGVTLDIHILVDKQRLPQEELSELLEMIGKLGYGGNASIGHGKFAVLDIVESTDSVKDNANAVFTLAPSAPQGLGYDAENSFYKVITRFGKHANLAAGHSNVFKNPIQLCDTGAMFMFLDNSDVNNTQYVGQGIGGIANAQQKLSHAIINTVHQGYAPVVPFYLKEEIMKNG